MKYFEGVLQIANLFLAVVAGIIGLSLYKVSKEFKQVKIWRVLILAFVLLSIQLVLGVLIAFNIYRPTFLTHLIPTIILVLLIYCVYNQIKHHTKKLPERKTPDLDVMKTPKRTIKKKATRKAKRKTVKRKAVKKKAKSRKRKK